MVLSPSSARGAARVALVVSLGGIALGALIAPSIPAKSPTAVTLFPPGDTTTVYGPTTLSTPSGSATNHVERFTVAVTPGRRYTLRLVNGGPNGSLKVTGGTVRLNGWETMTNADLASGATLERVVQVRTEDTLFATVQGPAGAYVTVSVLATPDPSFLVFGVERFIRNTGTPVTDTREFTVSPTAAAPFRLCIINGNTDGSQRISSAEIFINGIQVLSQNALNQHVASLSKEVPLQPGTNVMTVTLTAQPQGFLDLCVTATDVTPPVLTINAPPPNLITRDTLVTVTGTVQDETPTTVTVNGQAAQVTGGGFSKVTALPFEGHNTIHVVATDAAGHVTDSMRTVIRDRTPPVLTVNAPTDGFITRDTIVTVSGTVTDSTAVTVNVNGIPLIVGQGGAFSGSLALVEGHNSLVITATDVVGNATSVPRTVIRDRIGPVLTVNGPAQGLITRDTIIVVSVTATDSNAVTVNVNGIQLTAGQNGAFSGSIALIEGHNTLTITAVDAAGNQTAATRTVIRDRIPPALIVSAPADGFITKQTSVVVSGTVMDSTVVTVTADGISLTVGQDGGFSGPVPLSEGHNTLLIVARDAAGNETPATRTVISDTQAPVIVVSQPAEGDTVTTPSVNVVGTVTDSTAVVLTVNGDTVPLAQGGAFTKSVALVIGANTIILIATDQATNVATLNRHVVRKNPLPPDPATVASVVNRAEVTTIGDATAFLYTGASPIQTGVAAGTINPIRAAVLRGRVLDKNLQPLGGATVKILSHSELGQTLSRADGGYDLAVNGGSQLTVSYALGGYLPAQRDVNVPWQDYTPVDDVILVRPDTVATVVDLNAAAPAVARASVATDADGSRQATIIFKPGNSATLTPPGGTPQPITTLTVRATEFTVGNNGMLSMPAELPPASQYTYAVQLTADEQIVAGPGATVTLAQPVPVYVENFLEVPIGTKVPVGVYNAASGTWTPEPNGIVLRVLPPSNGLARIDITGDGVEDPGAYAALGIDDFERVQLAGVYPSGSDLWRAMAPSFEPLDLNFPFIFVGSTPTDGKVKAGCSSREGDPLRCQLQAQTAFQQVGIVGSPFTLNYASDRTQGNVADRKLDITLTGAVLPPQLIRVELEVDVAGKRFTGSFPSPTPNMIHAFTWDGRDLYGRLVQGTQAATVLIGYVFPVQYAAPANAVDAFGLPCSPVGSGTVCPFIAQGATPARAERTLVQRIETSIGTVDAVALGLGGFTLDVQNVYDPVGEVLYNGDGTRRAAAALPAGIQTVAGKPGSQISRVVNNVPALTVALAGSGAPMAPGPDGSIYFADGFQTLIQRLTPDGMLTTVAGKFPNGGAQCTGDNGPALQAGISFITGIAVAADGTIYFTDSGNCQRIRKIDPTGIVRHVAGVTATHGFSGDSGLATNAKISVPGALGLGPDGSLYFSDEGNRRIRRIAPDGIIMTVAGNGLVCGPGISIGTDAAFNSICGNGIIATKARLSSVLDLAVGPDGSIYVTYISRVRRITPDGIIRTFAGSALLNSSGDGGPATLAGIVAAWPLALGPDGSVYVGQGNNQTTGDTRIRRIAPNGIITTFAGNGTFGFSGDGGPATAARIGFSVRSMTVGKDGNLYIGDMDNARIRRVAGILPGFGVGQTVIASEEGSELYVFSPAGRLLLTLDPLTADTIRRFVYDGNRRLVAITDRNGRTITIERDAAGQPTAIVSPDGHRTNVTLGPDGMVAALTDAGNETLQFHFQPGGLLGGLTDFGGNTPSNEYDPTGRLIGSTGGPGVPPTTRSTFETDSGTALQYASSEGVEASGLITTLPGGERSYRGTLPDGRVIQTTVGADGTVTTHFANGTVATAVPVPDPVFGMQSPQSRVTTTLPSSLTHQQRRARAVTLAVPTDPLSVITEVDSVVINGRVHLTTFNKPTLTRTERTPGGRVHTTVLDSAGRVSSDQEPGRLLVTYEYDSAGRAIRVAQGDRVVTRTYGPDGLLAHTSDALGRVTDRSYSPTGQLTEAVLPGSDTVRLEYDENGNRIRVTPPGRAAHQFGHTAIGSRESYTAPAVGPTPTLTTWSRNDDNAVVSISLPDGGHLLIDRDSAGRVQSITSPTGVQSYTYNPASGYLASAVSEQGVAMSQQYDGSLLKVVEWSGPVAGRVSNTYDQNFWMIAQAVGTEPPIQFQHDLDGLPTHVGDLSISRNAASGVVTGTTLETVTSVREVNEYGDLKRLEYRTGSLLLLRLVYERDVNGRVEAVSEIRGSDSTRVSFGFDASGRLTSVTKDGVPVASYEYGANGNRTLAATPAGMLEGTVDAQDRLLAFGSTTYAYDANGQLIKKVTGTDTTRYQYDAGGKLRAVSLPSGQQVSYLLDALGRRVARTVDGVITQRYVYGSGFDLLAEVDGTGAATRRFVYGTRANVPDYMVKNGERFTLLTDNLGSVRLVINVATGDAVQEIDYDAFGQITRNTNPGFQPFAFAGGLLDDQTGLIQFGLRDYDPHAGRWTSKDPMLFEGGDWNLYAYAYNDPVNYIDPYGTSPLIEFAFAQFWTKIKNYVQNKVIQGVINGFLERAVEGCLAALASKQGCVGGAGGQTVTLSGLVGIGGDVLKNYVGGAGYGGAAGGLIEFMGACGAEGTENFTGAVWGDEDDEIGRSGAGGSLFVGCALGGIKELAEMAIKAMPGAKTSVKAGAVAAVIAFTARAVIGIAVLYSNQRYHAWCDQNPEARQCW
jgi:RHS repeat-associated protein